MHNKEKSGIFWIIFIAIVLIIAILIFPKHGFLSKEFHASEIRNLASNLTSFSAANYTLRKSNPSKGVPIENCKDMAKIADHKLLVDYQIKDQAIESDTVISCTLNGPGVTTLQFSVIGIS